MDGCCVDIMVFRGQIDLPREFIVNNIILYFEAAARCIYIMCTIIIIINNPIHINLKGRSIIIIIVRHM